ncbi:MAG: heme exporter protein CcmD [Pseudomonadota bacterium]
MPDLGGYALEVSLAYAVGLALLAVIILLSALRAKLVARRLAAFEARKAEQDDGV